MGIQAALHCMLISEDELNHGLNQGKRAHGIAGMVARKRNIKQVIRSILT